MVRSPFENTARETVGCEATLGSALASAPCDAFAKRHKAARGVRLQALRLHALAALALASLTALYSLVYLRVQDDGWRDDEPALFRELLARARWSPWG